MISDRPKLGDDLDSRGSQRAQQGTPPGLEEKAAPESDVQFRPIKQICIEETADCASSLIGALFNSVSAAPEIDAIAVAAWTAPSDKFLK